MNRNRSCSILISMFFVVNFVLLSGCTSDNSNNNSNSPSWMKNYASVHAVGTGEDDFWITFPSKNPSSGQEVTHLSWIVNTLKSKPLVFVCHKTGCAACTPQADRVKALWETYGVDTAFYDLDLPYSGDYTKDTETKFNEAFYYDPNGPPSYIAFTGVFTLINDEGEVKIGWHTWEGDVADSDMESWIKDSIYYYNMNS